MPNYNYNSPPISTYPALPGSCIKKLVANQRAPCPHFLAPVPDLPSIRVRYGDRLW